MSIKKRFLFLPVFMSILFMASCEEEITEVGSGFINGIEIQEPFLVENEHITAYKVRADQ